MNFFVSIKMECKCKPIKKMFENAVPLPFKTFYTKEYNDIRRLKLVLISDALNKFERFKVLKLDKKIEIMQEIEYSCVKEASRKANSYDVHCDWENYQYQNIYHSICYTVVSNINDPTVIQNILNENDYNLAPKSYKELNPKKYEELSTKIEKRINTERMIKATTLFYCKKCKHNETTIERVQLRSNDESSSLRITCLYCNNQWIK